jgi:hypothetical protein
MTLKLYWVQTMDHGEDWFIVARDEREAERLHEDMEGYARGEAEAEEILAIPQDREAEPGWPSEPLLLALGVNFKHDGAARVVEIGGRTYCEGLLEETIRSLDDDRFEAQGKGRMHGTAKPPKTPQ